MRAHRARALEPGITGPSFGNPGGSAAVDIGEAAIYPLTRDFSGKSPEFATPGLPGLTTDLGC
jgi:hypothetical protein